MGEEENKPSLFARVMGKEPSQIPCYRNSFLYGIGSGVGLYLTYFMATSNSRKAFIRGFQTYFGVTIIYWIVCRTQYSKRMLEREKIKISLRENSDRRQLEQMLEKEAKDI